MNSTGVLYRQLVSSLISKQPTYKPFVKEKNDQSPSWWRGYNQTKHNLPEGYRQGNLRNTMLALAGAYSLHCMAAYVRDFGDDVLEIMFWHDFKSISLNTQSEFSEVGEKRIISYIPKSKIFFCLSHYRNSLGGPMD